MADESTFQRRRASVADVMTRDVVTATVDTPYKDVERAMAEHRISGLPVVGAGGVPIGVVSEADLLAKAEVASDESPHGIVGRRRLRAKAGADTAAELMSTPADVGTKANPSLRPTQAPPAVK